MHGYRKRRHGFHVLIVKGRLGRLIRQLEKALIRRVYRTEIINGIRIPIFVIRVGNILRDFFFVNIAVFVRGRGNIRFGRDRPFYFICPRAGSVL